MVIKYRIKFDEDAVTITQSVEPSNGKVNDLAGDGLTEKGDGGGDGLTEKGDTGGDGLTEKGDTGGDGLTEKGDGGGTGLGRGRLMAVVLGPLVIGNVGPARAATKPKGESVKNPAVAGPGTILPRREGGPVPAVPAKPPTR